MERDKQEKLYYSIKEVADMFGVNTSLLRYWEKEFPQYISPRKTQGGVRQYRKQDIEMVRMIYHLLREKGMTISGARQKLKDNPKNTVNNYDIISKLQNIKKELSDIAAELNG